MQWIVGTKKEVKLKAVCQKLESLKITEFYWKFFNKIKWRENWLRLWITIEIDKRKAFNVV